MLYFDEWRNQTTFVMLCSTLQSYNNITVIYYDIQVIMAGLQITVVYAGKEKIESFKF